MKKNLLLIVVLMIVISCIAVFAACTEGELEVHELSISIEDFDYNGTVANPTINSNGEEYTIIWYSVSEAGELTVIESAPKEVGTYQVEVKLKSDETNVCTVRFQIKQATAVIEDFTIASKVYDGKAIAAPTYTTNSDSTNISIKYQKAGDTEWTAEAPKEVGAYNAKIEISGNKNYTYASAQTAFEIYAAPSLMELDVNPSIEVMVSYDNKVVNIEGKNQEGIAIKAELEAANAKGMSVDAFLSLYLDLLKDKGYLAVASEINLSTQLQGVESVASQALATKLNALGSTATINAHTITNDEIVARAKSYLLNYTDSQIEAMDINVLSNLLFEAKEEDTITNGAIKDIYRIVRAYKVLICQLESMIEEMNKNPLYATAASSLESAKNSLDSSMATVIDTYISTYASSFSIYAIAEKNYYQAKEAYLKEAKIDPQSFDAVLAAAKFNSGKSSLESLETARENLVNTILTSFRTASNSVLTIISTLNLDVNVDKAAIEKQADEYLNTLFGKEVEYNPVTGEGLYIKGDVSKYYYCEQMNKTFVFNSNVNSSTTGLMMFVFEGNVAQSDLEKTQVSDYATSVYDVTTQLYVQTSNGQLTFDVDSQGNVSLSFAEGSLVYLDVIDADFTSYTVGLFENNGVKIGYVFDGEVAEKDLLKTPTVASGTWKKDGNNITGTLGGITLNYVVSGNSIVIQVEDGTLNYQYQENTAPDRSFRFRTVNGVKIVYWIAPFYYELDTSDKYPYQYVGTWTEEVIEGITHVDAKVGGYEWNFTLKSNGELSLDSSSEMGD